MNAPLFLLVVWFSVGVLLTIFSLWYMKTHEKEMVDQDPEYQISGCIPPPVKWAVVILLLLFGPMVLLRAIYETIQESPKEKDENASSGRTPAAAPAPATDPQAGCTVLFGLLGAAVTAWIWASEHPAKPWSTFLGDQARTFGFWLLVFVVPGLMANWRQPIRSLRFPLLLLPVHVTAELVPSVMAMSAGWDGGWALGIAGALAGTAAGAVVGWLFSRWMLPQTESYPSERRPRQPGSHSRSG